MPSLDVHLVTWNGAAVLAECLASLRAQTNTSWTLRIFDNNSIDNSQEVLRQWTVEHGGELHLEVKNIGFAAAHNALLRQSHADYVLVLNQDVVLAPTYIENLLMYIEAHTDVASATGLLFRSEITPAGIQKKNIVDSAGLLCRRTHRVIERARDTNGQGITTGFVFGIPATAALYRKSALMTAVMNANGHREFFDESYGSYKEDVDLAYRLQLLGWRSACVVEAEGWHVRSLRGGDDMEASFGTLKSIEHRKEKDPKLNQQSYANHLMMLRSNMFFPIWSSVWWLTLLYEVGKFLVILVTEPETMRAWQEVRSQRERILTKRRELRDRKADWHRVLSVMK